MSANDRLEKIEALVLEIAQQNIALGQQLGQRIEEANKRTSRTEDLIAELVKQNLALGNRIDETNRNLGNRIDETNKRIDATLEMIYKQHQDLDKKHREAVELFYILREALERLPDVVREQIGFEIQPKIGE